MSKLDLMQDLLCGMKWNKSMVDVQMFLGEILATIKEEYLDNLAVLDQGIIIIFKNKEDKVLFDLTKGFGLNDA